MASPSTVVPRRAAMDRREAEQLAAQVVRESDFVARVGHDRVGHVVHVMDAPKRRPGRLGSPRTVRDYADWMELRPAKSDAAQEAEAG